MSTIEVKFRNPLTLLYFTVVLTSEAEQANA
jgi:hypothetical protein